MTLLRVVRATRDTSRVVSLLPAGRLAGRLRDAGVAPLELNFRSASGIVRGLAALAGEIRGFEPDVVQSWMYHADLAATLALALSRRRRRTALVWGIRGSEIDFTNYRLQLRLVVNACARLSARPDAIIANSVAGLEAHRLVGYRPRHAAVIHNGIDAELYRPDPQARAAVRQELGLPANAMVAAHVARVDPMKDHATFLAAMAQLPHLHGLLVGALTDRLDAPPNVRALGLRDDVPRVLAAADVIVSSSAFGEGFSNALAEGMACGLPAIATDVGDARLILADTGAIVPPRDPKALAQVIAELTQEDEPVRRERSRRARARIVHNFSIERTIVQFNAVYDAILAAQARP